MYAFLKKQTYTMAFEECNQFVSAGKVAVISGAYFLVTGIGKTMTRSKTLEKTLTCFGSACKPELFRPFHSFNNSFVP